MTLGQDFAGLISGQLSKVIINKIQLDFEGLYPVLVLVPGHIFVGYWRRDPDSGDGPRPQWYPDRPCIRNQVRIAELVQGGWLGAIESTMLATGSEASFADAGAKSHWIKQLDLAFEEAARVG